MEEKKSNPSFSVAFQLDDITIRPPLGTKRAQKKFLPLNFIFGFGGLVKKRHDHLCAVLQTMDKIKF